MVQKKVYFFFGVTLIHSTFVSADTSFTLDQDSIPAITPVATLDVSKLQTDADLFLNVSVNHYPSSDLIRVKTNAQGQFFISALDLRSLRLKIDSHIVDTEWVNLKDLPWLHYEYDLSNQTLLLDVPVDYLARYAVNLSDDTSKTTAVDSQPFNATIFNYNLYQNYSQTKKYLAASGHLMMNHSWGSLSSLFSYSNEKKTDDNHQNFVRLSSYWQYIDPVKIRSYTLGDFVSNSTQWNSSVRLLGLQWASAYEQRGDIVTIASPELSGTATLPSTLDLYVNQQKIYSGAIPSGPFDVKSLPFVSGNQVTLVTTDMNGQQSVSTKPYYTSVKILQKGINQFSVDVGVPRFNYSTRSNDYAPQLLFSSSSLRYGLTPRLTVDGGLELSSNGLLNLGVGVATNIFDRGVLSTNVAASQYDGQTGALVSSTLEFKASSKLNLNMSVLNGFDGYFNLGRVADRYYVTHYVPSSTLPETDSTSSAKQVLRLGANYQLASGTSVYLGYNAVMTSSNRYKQLSLSLSKSLSRSWGLFFSAYQDMINQKNFGAYLTLRYTPQKSALSITTTAGVDGDVTSQQVDIASSSTQSLNSLGWGVSASHSQDVQGLSAYLNYIHRYAYLSAKYNYSNMLQQVGLSATGALVFAENKLFAANQVGDGYALVKNAGPRTKVINGGVTLGEADSKGNFFISDLTPYRTHTIYANPANLPLDWRIDSTEKKLTTGYKRGASIDFKAHQVVSAIVHLVNAKQVDLGAGYTVTVNGQSQAVLGYDGEVFVDGLLKHNTLTVDLLGEGECTAQFDYNEKNASGIEKIGPFVCQ